MSSYSPSRVFSSLAGRRLRRILFLGALLLAASLEVASLQAGIPANLGFGLQDLAQDFRAARSPGAKTLTAAQFSKVLANYPHARTDASRRVLVDVFLDGSVKIDEVIKQCRALGCTVNARIDWYRHGALSMYLPLEQAAKLGRLPGVNSAHLDLPPKHYVGNATSQGTVVLKSDLVNSEGYLGAGITIGALSDSYNTATNGSTQPLTTAPQDVQNGDLPGVGNPNGYLTPVNVLEDYGSTAATAGTDEGRAMLQIESDVAPAAALAFATADVSEIGFAQNIIALATPTNQRVTIPASTVTVPTSTTGAITVNGAGCQVICDDVGYYDEPMFSDGVVAQAVDTVANTYNVSYFSAAGNDGSSGYAATYLAQPNNAANQALLLSEGGITYSSIPAAEAAVIESFHAFGTNSSGQPVLVQKVMQTKDDGQQYNGTIIFQWDDPVDVVNGGVNQETTDYDILTFSVNPSTGAATYQANRSGTKNNFSTNEPVEIPSGQLIAGTQYEFVIVRTNRTPAAGVIQNAATHIRWAVASDASSIVADYNTPNSVNTYGHDCAASCIGMAAYVYDNGYNYLDNPYVPQVEDFSSNGPTVIYFDSAGNRLATPLTRKQPTLSATDGVDTSFFGSDSDGDGLPNFFGTSATGPHAAACAALLLDVAATQGITLGWQDIRELLVSTTQGQQDLDPSHSSGTAGPLQFSAVSRGTYTDPNAYTLTYNGATGTQLTQLVFDLTPINFRFFISAYPVTMGAATVTTGIAPAISGSSAINANSETITFSNFNPGDTLAFGVAIGNASSDIELGDSLAGASFTATISGDPDSPYTGTLANLTGRRWNVKSGFGLIDVNAAVNRLRGQ